jgi:hypothetical protein
MRSWRTLLRLAAALAARNAESLRGGAKMAWNNR